MAAIQAFSPARLVLLKQKCKAGSPEAKELAENERLIKKTVGVVSEVVGVEVEDSYDIYAVAKQTVRLIEEEHAKKQEIVVNVTGAQDAGTRGTVRLLCAQR